MFFEKVLEALPDPIFGLNEAFHSDPRKKKVNLAVGVYKDDQLSSYLMPSVKKAKEEIFSQDLLADYLAIEGLAAFSEEIGKLCFGKKLFQENHGRISAFQAVGGTGALRLAADFLLQEVSSRIAIPDPTWANHHWLFSKAGFEVISYPYYQKEKNQLEFDAFCLFLRNLKEGTILLFHVVCQNPTGVDFSLDQWKIIQAILEEKKHLPFFDFAYQGFGEGIEKDRKVVEYFLETKMEMVVAYSCSKNFSLYCQRVGALFFVTKNPATKIRVESKLKRVVRSLYSNPPAHGAKIVSHLLQNDFLRKEWEKELDAMRKRLDSMRSLLAKKLIGKTLKDYRFLLEQKGMFSFLGLSKNQVMRLIQEHAIYMPDWGRISIAALNQDNIDFVADAIISL